MIVIISPAKTLDFDQKDTIIEKSEIRQSEKSKQLIEILKEYSSDELQSLMKISEKLGDLNYHRYQLWSYPFLDKDTRACLLAFRGEVYTGIDADTLSKQDIDFAQNHLRILSGLYGLLRPLDAIMPYRLEMGTKLTHPNGKNLYDFWGNEITQILNTDFKTVKTQVLINLASNEYFKAIHKKTLNARIITPVFRDLKNGEYKVISFYAKKARGLMTRFILQNKISNPEELIAFNDGGYYYSEAHSSPDQPVFIRDTAQ